MPAALARSISSSPMGAGPRPIFWIDLEARVLQHPILPQSLGCDFAVYKHPSGEMETGAVFLHQTEAAGPAGDPAAPQP